MTGRRTCAVVDPCLFPGASLVSALAQRGLDIVGLFTPGGHQPTSAADERLLSARIDLGLDSVDATVARLAVLNLSAIFVGDESGVEWTALLAHRLGLPGHDPALAHACVDKHAMNVAVRDAGLRTLPSQAASNADAVLPWWRSTLTGAPVVVKPLRGWLGQGLRICTDEAELRSAFSELGPKRRWDGQQNDEVLVQQLGHGLIYEVGLVSRDGRHEVTLVLESFKSGPVFDALHVIGAHELKRIAPQCQYARAVASALGIRNGATFVEVMILPSGEPVMIECNARLIGGLSDSYIHHVLAVSQVSRFLDAMLDPERFYADFCPVRGARMPARLVVLRSDTAGVIAGPVEELVATLRGLPSCVGFRTGSLIRGERLLRTIDAGSSPGCLYLAHPDLAVVEADHRRVRQLERDGAYRAIVGAP